ncbi:malonate transporter subunit MadL [Rhodoplanes sp. TEM]|uniref:Malonate transporter subunit MadL n=1 Tax=Rhodoplanes tepidamans TaxID=200616 RepID=A0ABT5J623_RHOTP|nr:MULTISPECIES: malonate transporter subunit MadL [Rhodoplanes]MDC7784968.1 malonate transporter subunit MadL [Rhodoplanes tepidamans]MDC7985836.1 malonate transporter subunit MadL [Rhodoplanes sp. TEM]MDQ0353803.1 malonate transporter MadL subunit [Rhodoplanes tepidamans]
MVIYGVMILGLCMFLGTAVGLLLGKLLGIPGDIGGVGFAMLFLVFLTNWLKGKGMLPKPTEQGMLFWNAMYIPVVIAMASIQNVVAALNGGLVALLAGIVSVVVLFPLIRILSAMAGAATSSFGDEEADAPAGAQPKKA